MARAFTTDLTETKSYQLVCPNPAGMIALTRDLLKYSNLFDHRFATDMTARILTYNLFLKHVG